MDNEEFLTTKELSTRIKMAVGTIRNLVSQGQLVQGVHYIKPTPRKILFLWSSVQSWMYDGPSKCHGVGPNKLRSRSRIRI